MRRVIRNNYLSKFFVTSAVIFTILSISLSISAKLKSETYKGEVGSQELDEILGLVCKESLIRNQKAEIFLSFLRIGDAPFQNLFQTDDGNLGIRVEVTDRNALAIVIGGPDDPQLEGIETDESILEGLNLLQLSVSKGKLTMKLNGSRSKSVVFTNEPRCTNPRFGIGYSEERRFDGLMNVIIRIQ